MGQIRVLSGVGRRGAALFERFDIAAYANKTFGMFGGREEIVTLEFESRFIGVVIDRFGKEVPVRPRGQDHFSVRVQVALSGQFYGWLTGLGVGAKITAPAKVVEEYRSYLRKELAQYDG